jgi:hypothetical protein
MSDVILGSSGAGYLFVGFLLLVGSTVSGQGPVAGCCECGD